MAEIRVTVIGVGEDMERLGITHRSANGSWGKKTPWQCLLKLETHLAYDPAILCENTCPHKDLYVSVHSSFIANGLHWNSPNVYQQ